jgi:hypothetical protein
MKNVIIIAVFFISQSMFSQITLTSMRGVFSSKIPTTMFSGGKSSIESQQYVIQFFCPPSPVVDIFYGGTGTGNQEVQLVQNSCTPASVVAIFYGGTGIGIQETKIIQAACTY